MTIELPEFGGDLARRIRSLIPAALIRKDAELGRGGPVMRVTGASPEEMKALRATLSDIGPSAIVEGRAYAAETAGV